MSPGRWVSGFAGGAALYPSHIPAVRAALRPWQDKEDYWKPIFARRDFAKESEKAHKALCDLPRLSDHATTFSLQRSPPGLIKKGDSMFSRPAN